MPRTDDGARPGPRPRSLRPRARGGRSVVQAFVVEDSALVVQGLVAALAETESVRVVGTAADEPSALRRMRPLAAELDLVIIDVFLRVGSGLGVLRAVRRSRLAVRCVMLSNYTSEAMRARCLALGADRVFDKSAELDELMRYCARLADHPAENGAPESLAASLLELQQRLQGLFIDMSGDGKRRGRSPLQRRLLVGLALLSKVEEQVVLPSIAESAPGGLGAIEDALHEIDMMRDVALLAAHTARENREIALGVLEGLALLHFERMNALMAQHALSEPEGSRARSEVRALLRRWQQDAQIDGAIEDEDRDPVGPR